MAHSRSASLPVVVVGEREKDCVYGIECGCGEFTPRYCGNRSFRGRRLLWRERNLVQDSLRQRFHMAAACCRADVVRNGLVRAGCNRGNRARARMDSAGRQDESEAVGVRPAHVRDEHPVLLRHVAASRSHGHHASVPIHLDRPGHPGCHDPPRPASSRNCRRRGDTDGNRLRKWSLQTGFRRL